MVSYLVEFALLIVVQPYLEDKMAYYFPWSYVVWYTRGLAVYLIVDGFFYFYNL
jgi:hypothetical protein